MVFSINLKWVLPMWLALASFVHAGVISEIKNTEIHGDGPWKGHVDDHLLALNEHKDVQIQEVEHHAEKTVQKIEIQKKTEQEYVLEHEAAAKIDIENRNIVEQKLLLKKDVEFKLQELEKHMLEYQALTTQIIQELHNKVQELLQKRVQVDIEIDHKIKEFDIEKRQLLMTKLDLEKIIDVKLHEIEAHKQEEQRRLVEHEQNVKHKIEQELKDLEHHKLQLELKQQKDEKFHKDLDQYKHQGDIDYKVQDHTHDILPTPIDKPLSPTIDDHHTSIVEEQHDEQKLIITHISEGVDPHQPKATIRKRHVPIHGPTFDHGPNPNLEPYYDHHFEHGPHGHQFVPPGPPHHHYYDFAHGKLPHDFEHGYSHGFDHGPHSHGSGMPPFHGLDHFPGCGHGHEHGTPPIYQHGKPPVYEHGKPPVIESKPPMFEHQRPVYGQGASHDIGHGPADGMHDVKGLATKDIYGSSYGGQSGIGSSQGSGLDDTTRNILTSQTGVSDVSAGSYKYGGQTGNGATYGSGLDGLVSNIFTPQSGGDVSGGLGGSERYGGSSINQQGSGSSFSDISGQGISNDVFLTGTSISKGVQASGSAYGEEGLSSGSTRLNPTKTGHGSF